MKWECFVCWKVNEDEEVTNESCICRCCGRPRNFFPRSTMNKSQAKPLVLHGLAAAQHTFHPSLIFSLQQAGLDLTATYNTGWTALHCAAMIGDAIAVHYILQSENENLAYHSKILEAPRSGGWRALHLATRGGHFAVVEELLLANVDVDAQLDNSDDALTSLHIAAKKGFVEILDLLLQCGADATLVTHHLRHSPLHVAVSAGQERCVRLLLANPNLFGLRDSDGLTALQLAHLLPASSEKQNQVQREIIVLLDAHEPYGAKPPTLMHSLLD